MSDDICLHCKITEAIGNLINDQLGGSVDRADLLGAVIEVAADVIRGTDTPKRRRSFLQQAERLLRKSSRPERPEIRHEH